MSTPVRRSAPGRPDGPRLPAFYTRQVAETANQSARCQKCFQRGHWTYQCTGKRKYLERESHTKQLDKRMLVSANGQARVVVAGASSKSSVAKAKTKKSNSSSSSSSSSDSSSSSTSSSTSSSGDSSDDEDSSEDEATRQKKIELLKRMIELRKQQKEEEGKSKTQKDHAESSDSD